MQVFRPSDLTHTLVFIPRVSTTTVLLKIRNELRDTENSIGVVGSVTNNVFMGSFSYDFKEGGTYEIEVVDNLEYPYISYRFWTLDKSLDTLNNKYLDMIRLKYKVNELYDKMKLDNKVYLSLDSKFDWPSTSSSYYK